jgi:hypothetical protein
VLHFDLDGGSDLGHLGLYQDGSGVPLRVVLGKDGKGLIVAVLGDEPTGRFGQEVDEDDLQKRRAHLHQRRHTPTPVSGNLSGADRNSSRDNGADEV